MAAAMDMLELDFHGDRGGDKPDQTTLAELVFRPEEAPSSWRPLRAGDEAELLPWEPPRTRVLWHPELEEVEPPLEKPELRPFPEIPYEADNRLRRRAIRARTIPVKRLTQQQIRIGRMLYPEVDFWRPRTRGECTGLERPCPYVACRWNLYLDVNHSTGSIKLNFPDLEPWEVDPRCSCALDIADSGGWTLEDIGVAMNLTRERVRQLELRGLEMVREAQASFTLEDYV